MNAAVYGKSDVITELISLGADVDIQNKVSHLKCLIMILSGLPNLKTEPSTINNLRRVEPIIIFD